MSKKWIFQGIMWIPLMALMAISYHFVFQTNAPQQAYLNYVRDMNFDCFEIVPEPYAYKFKPGTCTLNNAEYRTTQHIDNNGFRNPDESFYQTDTVAIGDSHTFGLGVNDEDTLSRQLTDFHGIKTLNLGIPTYATYRELETLQQYAPHAKNVILQYCDNDFDENQVYLGNSADRYKVAEDSVRKNIKDALNAYHASKGAGWQGGLRGIAQTLTAHEYAPKADIKASVINRAQLPDEAEAFARTLSTHHDLLQGKHIVVFESSSYGLNSPNFQQIFQAAVKKQLPDLDITVLDSTHVVNPKDFYFLDDHPRPSAFKKLARALAENLQQPQKTS